MMQECQPIDSSVELPVPPATVVQQVLNITQLIPSGPVDNTSVEMSPNQAGSNITVNRAHISKSTYYIGSFLAALAGLLLGLGIAQGFAAGLIAVGVLFGMGALGSFITMKAHDIAQIVVDGNENNTFMSVSGSIDPDLLINLNMTLCAPYGISL